jgi:hypothetical protein
MSKFRVSTCIDADQVDHQFFEHKIEAENAAAELARGGFFSTLWESGECWQPGNPGCLGNDGLAWHYLCEYAPYPKAVQS